MHEEHYRLFREYIAGVNRQTLEDLVMGFTQDSVIYAYRRLEKADHAFRTALAKT